MTDISKPVWLEQLFSGSKQGAMHMLHSMEGEPRIADPVTPSSSLLPRQELHSAEMPTPSKPEAADELESQSHQQEQDPTVLCANCGHAFHYHEDAYGCEVEGGDRWVTSNGPNGDGWVASGPCGCKDFEPEVL